MAMKGAKALEVWSRRAAEGYPGVRIANMSSSWRDGKAFCAIIHRYRPDLIHWDQVQDNDVKSNCTMAFSIAEKELDIPSLLDPQDMADCTTPDRLSILTYLSEFYHKFKDEKSPLGSPSTIINMTKSNKTSSIQTSKLSATPPSKSCPQVVVTPSTRNFVSNYLQESANMLSDVSNSVIEKEKKDVIEEKEKYEIKKKKDVIEEKEKYEVKKKKDVIELEDKREIKKNKDEDRGKGISGLLGGVTEMICDIDRSLSSAANAENEIIKEMPDQIVLDKEKLENPHISSEKEPITPSAVLLDTAIFNEKKDDSEMISNTLKSGDNSSKNIYGARKKQTKSSQEISDLVEESKEEDANEEVTSKRDNETHGGDLKRKDSCDSGVSLSPLGSACNSPPSSRSDKSSNVAKAVELFKSQNEKILKSQNGQKETSSKGVTNVWRNKFQSNSSDQIKGSSPTNKTEENPANIIGGAKAKVKDEQPKHGKKEDKSDQVNTTKGGVVFKVNNRPVFSNTDNKNKADNDTAPLYNPKPYRPWGSNVLRMSQSFTNNKNKFISQTTLNSSNPADSSHQAPVSFTTFKSTPSLLIPKSSYGPTSLSVHSSTPQLSSLSSSGSASLNTKLSCPSLLLNKPSKDPISLNAEISCTNQLINKPSNGPVSLNTQISCPSLPINKSSTGPISLSIQNRPSYKAPLSFQKSYAGPASLLIHSSPPLPTSLPPAPASFSKDSFLDPTSIIIPSTSPLSESVTIPKLSPDLEAVKIIKSFPNPSTPTPDPQAIKMPPESSPIQPSLSANTTSKDKSLITISTPSPDQSFSSRDNLSSDQSILSINKSSPDQSFSSINNLSSDQSILSINKSSSDQSYFSINSLSLDQSTLSISKAFSEKSILSNNSSPDESFHSFSKSFQDKDTTLPLATDASLEEPVSSFNTTHPPSSSFSIVSSSPDLLPSSTSNPSPEPPSLSPVISPSYIHSEDKVESEASSFEESVSAGSTQLSSCENSEISTTTQPLPITISSHMFSTTTAITISPASGHKSTICDKPGPQSSSYDRPKSLICDKFGPISLDRASPISLGSDRPVTFDNGQPEAVTFKAAMRKFRSMTCINQPSQEPHLGPKFQQLLSPKSGGSGKEESGGSKSVLMSAPASKSVLMSAPSSELPLVSPTGSELQVTTASHGQSQPSGHKDMQESSSSSISTSSTSSTISSNSPSRWKVSPGYKLDKQTTVKPESVININIEQAVTKDADNADNAATRHDTIADHDEARRDTRDTQSKVKSKEGGEVTVKNDAGYDIPEEDKDVDNDIPETDKDVDGDDTPVNRVGAIDGADDEVRNKRWTDNAINKQTDKRGLRKSQSLSHTILNSVKSDSLSHTILNSEYEAGNQPFTITI